MSRVTLQVYTTTRLPKPVRETKLTFVAATVTALLPLTNLRKFCRLLPSIFLTARTKTANVWGWSGETALPLPILETAPPSDKSLLYASCRYLRTSEHQATEVVRASLIPNLAMLSIITSPLRFRDWRAARPRRDKIITEVLVQRDYRQSPYVYPKSKYAAFNKFPSARHV